MSERKSGVPGVWILPPSLPGLIILPSHGASFAGSAPVLLSAASPLREPAQRRARAQQYLSNELDQVESLDAGAVQGPESRGAREKPPSRTPQASRTCASSPPHLTLAWSSPSCLLSRRFWPRTRRKILTQSCGIPQAPAGPVTRHLEVEADRLDRVVEGVCQFMVGIELNLLSFFCQWYFAKYLSNLRILGKC